MVQRPDDGADPRDFDERWAEIVADLGEGEDVAWPAAEPVPDEPGPRGGHVVRAADERVLSGRDWDGTEQIDAAEDAVDEQEHFVPPDPGPVLSGDPLRILTWSVAIGVPRPRPLDFTATEGFGRHLSQLRQRLEITESPA